MTDQIVYPPNPLTWAAVVVSVHDGDTATFDIDLGQKLRAHDHDIGFHLHVAANRLRLHNPTRFYGINAAELGTPSGDTAAQALKQQLPAGSLVTLETWLDQSDKYGRVLAAVHLGTLDVNQWLVDQGYAAIYYGFGPKPVPVIEQGMRIPTLGRQPRPR